MPEILYVVAFIAAIVYGIRFGRSYAQAFNYRLPIGHVCADVVPVAGIIIVNVMIDAGWLGALAALVAAFCWAGTVARIHLWVEARTPHGDSHYLGRFAGDQGDVELYIKLDGARSTVLVRDSSGGTGEVFGVSAYGFVGAVTAAIRRAENCGLIAEGRDFVRI